MRSAAADELNTETRRYVGRWPNSPCLRVEAGERGSVDARADADGVAQLAQGPCLDVTHALAGHVQLVGQLLQRVDATVAEAVPVLDHAPLLRLQHIQDLAQVPAVRRGERVLLGVGRL